MLLSLVLLFTVLFLPRFSFAIVPPEFIVTVSSNLLQILGLVSIAIFSIYSALGVIIRRGHVFVKAHVLPIVIVVNLIAGGVLYFNILRADNELSSLSFEAEVLRNKLLLAEETIGQLTDNERKQAIITDCSLNRVCQNGRKFISDTYVVVGNNIVLELDINRLEVEPGSGIFNHYAYLNGTFLGTPVTDYMSFVATTSDSFSFDFLKEFTLKKASDLSSRESHTISLLIDETSTVQFSIPSSDANFVTRNSPAYTRTHSIATTTIHVGESIYPIEAHAYIEKTYSDDADSAVFFSGRDELGIKTVQFILWDTAGNFYLFDKSDVERPVPQYQSHTWALTKSASGLAQKGYLGSYHEVLGRDKLGWKIILSDFNNAEIEVTAREIYKSLDRRLRISLTGKIADFAGVRELTGVAHIVD
jgi:hypothetical protein